MLPSITVSVSFSICSAWMLGIQKPVQTEKLGNRWQPSCFDGHGAIDTLHESLLRQRSVSGTMLSVLTDFVFSIMSYYIIYVATFLTIKAVHCKGLDFLHKRMKIDIFEILWLH